VISTGLLNYLGQFCEGNLNLYRNRLFCGAQILRVVEVKFLGDREGGEDAYVPVDRRVSLIKHNRIAPIHRLASLVGILRALQDSVSEADNSTALLERTTTNPHIPVRLRPMVSQRVRREVEADMKLEAVPSAQEDAGGHSFAEPGLASYTNSIALCSTC